MNIDPMNADRDRLASSRIWHQNGRQVTIVATNGTVLTNTNYSRLDLIHGSHTTEGETLIALGVGRVPEGEPGEVEGCELQMSIPYARWLRDELTSLLAVEEKHDV